MANQEAVKAQIRSERYPIKLFVWEAPTLLKSTEEVEAFLKSRPNISEMTYLAYIEQFQQYAPGFKPEQANEKRYNLHPGDEFEYTYQNRPLVFKEKGLDPKTLAHVIDLEAFGLVTRIEDVVGAHCVADRSGKVDDKLYEIMRRAITEWAGQGDVEWTWQKNYPHVSIASINLPKFTEQIVAAGKSVGSEVRVYRV